MAEPIEGGCLCGAVRYRADGPPRWIAHCHCRSCRRQTGSTFATYLSVDRARFAFTVGEPVRFPSSEGVVRASCGRCGTPLTYESVRWADETHILLGTLDRPELFPPQAHAYVDEKLPWLRIDDGLPQSGSPSA